MRKKIVFRYGVTVMVLLAGYVGMAHFLGGSDSVASDKVGTPREISWQDLVPEDFTPPENPLLTMSQEEIDKLMDGSPESRLKLEKLQEEYSYAPTVPSLDGLRVKLPAYITPLEFDGQMRFEEFLLVPYQGACIHVPPPPANQVVHAESEEVIEVDNPYDPVWAIGTIHVDTVLSDLAEAGYRLEVESVQPYQY